MNELYTKYLGLDLRSPLIAGSCNLTDNADNLKEIEKAGAGAVVLKSIFEEEIYLEYASELKKMGPMEENLEFLDYYDVEIRQDNLKRYLGLITSAKAALHIPVIASINCVTSQNWSFFAEKIEAAGADALELNLFILPSDLRQSSSDNENTYFGIIRQVTSRVKIPVSVKISPYFSNLGRMIQDISASGIKGMVLFNRFYSPDIDIDREIVRSAPKLSSPDDYLLPLRWIGMMANRVECDLAASTGVHDWKSAVKLLLAGAQTVQLVSVLYKEGFKAIADFNTQIVSWMEKKNYAGIEDFRGKLAMGTQINPAEYERVQFMKTFSEYTK
ncbi:MAG TPA: dihydroorotate dehydrogenase-like protein [Prolixibacteraceae bacterium]|nr:dihydroorotate dehydrogenase-like protein [Prolixibacteraceae bacterium]HQJ86637.1 dihydroorotate dehydrogenase-like protein [Prolixibacteraceae bacterium]